MFRYNNFLVLNVEFVLSLSFKSFMVLNSFNSNMDLSLIMIKYNLGFNKKCFCFKKNSKMLSPKILFKYILFFLI